MINPLRDLVYVTPIMYSNKVGSLFIPDESIERCNQGVVKYIGPKVKDIKIGMYVMFSGYTGTTIRLEKDAEGTVIVMRERFVQMILLPPDTEVNGLYFKGTDGSYFSATYEMAMNLIAESFSNTDFARNTGFVNPLGARGDKGSKPELEDYDDEDDDL